VKKEPAVSRRKQPPSSSSSSSPVARKPGLLVLDGGYVRRALEQKLGLRTDESVAQALQILIRLLEREYGVYFVKKTLHAATPDGRPTLFHYIISHPDTGHVEIKTRGKDCPRAIYL